MGHLLRLVTDFPQDHCRKYLHIDPTNTSRLISSIVDQVQRCQMGHLLQLHQTHLRLTLLLLYQVGFHHHHHICPKSTLERCWQATHIVEEQNPPMRRF